ncbi:MAG TPA: DUF1269 domain-containing protein [Methylibium sp.]|nr:DUF1269 domain-containing protein [Methylibium sp.]
MRRRVYWLLPDLPSARRTTSDLLLARIPESHIHFVAAENADTTGLHVANPLQTSDVLRSARLGLVVGGLAGAVVGVAAALFVPVTGDAGLAALRAVTELPQWGVKQLLATFESPQWSVAGILAIAGGVIGAWSASMIGAGAPSHRLARFAGAIEQGQFLLMVDAPALRVGEIESLLHNKHPEAHFEGIEPEVPAFP